MKNCVGQAVRGDNFWNRENFKKLKEKLSKLIRPDLNTSDEVQKFKIILTVPDEFAKDRDVINKYKLDKNTEIEQYYNTVNGEIKNFVFNELDIKTTRIESKIDSSGVITTRLTDRDNFVYEISLAINLTENKKQNKHVVTIL